MKKTIKTAVLGLMWCTGAVFADSTNINFIIGPAYSNISNEQYMSPVTGLINSYASNEQVKTRLFYGVGAEYNFENLTSYPITLGLGLSWYHMGSGNITGIETPGVNILAPPQDTLTYAMQTKNSAILVEPKLVYTTFHWQPYVLGGLGSARNNLSYFSEGVVQGSLAAPSASPYPSHTQTKFAYEAGGGLQYIFREFKNNHAILFHIEYRYLNLGQSSLGTAPAQTTNQHITLHNTSNIIDFGITYRI